MPKKRAQITREAADEMYEDVIDRVTAARETQAASTPQRTAKPQKPPLVKVTVYMTAEDVLAIDELVSREFRATGKRPRRSTIVSRAIQALHEWKRETEDLGVNGEG
jgi:hypothetical protein